MADLLALSARYIDNDIYEGAGLINRPTTDLSEPGNGIALIEAFSHVVVFKTGDGLVLFDTSLERQTISTQSSVCHNCSKLDARGVHGRAQ